MKNIFAKPITFLAYLWLFFLIIGYFIAPSLATHDPLEQDLLAIKQLPTLEKWLGTDALGRDVYSRIMHALPSTISGVFQAVTIVTLIGITLGVTAGYFGGIWDKCVVQYVTLMQSLPLILILLVVLAVFGKTMISAMITLGILGSSGVSRVVRSVTLSVREELYIAAARISGLSDIYIIINHVLPRIVGPIIVQLSLFAATAVILQTGIAFLGLGVAPPAPSWGGMIFEASASLNDFPWLLVPTGLVVAFTILSFGFIGDSLRDQSTEKWSKAVRIVKKEVRSAIIPTDIPENSLLSLRNITIKTGDRILVDNLSFDLKKGETLGIVGESGSGKTLTISALMGLLPSGVTVTAGVIVYKGKAIDLTDEKQLKTLRGQDIGMIFQEPMSALDPCYTIGYQLNEVVRLNNNLSHLEIKARVIELLTLVKINSPEDVARKYPHQISGGMAQRVSIARALAREPHILLADEPTTALDVTVQAEILSLLKSLSQSRQMAVILVTHDWGVVADICDRAMVLRHGKMLEEADVVMLFHNPKHIYTKALLAANPHSATPGQPLPTVQDIIEGVAS